MPPNASPLASCVLGLIAGATSLHAVDGIRLASDEIECVVTPKWGGRGLHLSLPGRENIFRLGPATREHPDPGINPFGDSLAYLGHTIWLGPQSEWWAHQEINRERRDAEAPWPPDPFLNYGPASVTEQSAERVVLRGMPSPVAGMRVTKGFAIDEDEAGSVRHWVKAENIRDEPVAWDIWFNTRVAPTVHVYVPIDESLAPKFTTFGDPTKHDLEVSVVDGILSPAPSELGDGLVGIKGKVALQPSKGWMAMFTSQEVFFIHFPLQPLEKIHPEQGQVELYLDWEPANPEAGVLEMEVHAPYLTLKPDETMTAEEVWTVLPYEGEATAEAHRNFLRNHFSEQ